MMTNWERRIRHIDRKVKPTGMRGLRGQMIKADVKERRGLPSRNLPADLVLQRITIKLRTNGEGDPTPEVLDHLERAAMHWRLTERTRRERDTARRRARPSVLDTRIYLWRRRQAWLRDAEASTVEPQD